MIAHVGDNPIEEALGLYGPAFLLAAGAAWATHRARLRGLRARRPLPGVPQRRWPARRP